MADAATLLERLKRRRVEVDLRTPNRTPLKAITIYGRCVSALNTARIPEEERAAFVHRAGEHVRKAATESGEPAAYTGAVVNLMNRYDDAELLRVVSEYLVVHVNWDGPGGD